MALGTIQGKHDIERSTNFVPILPAHEQMEEDRDGLEASKLLLEQRKEKEGGLPPCYYDHPVVEAADPGEVVLPIATYIDAVPYSHTDGVIGWWVINLLDSRHYLCMVSRKRNMCQCGCKGWCTLYTYFRMFAWFLRALASGVHPGESVLGPFEDNDKIRIQNSGKPLGFKAACLYFKGDWAELGTTAGFPSWMDGFRPCFGCNAPLENLHDPQSSMHALTWLVNSEQDYFSACSRCEKIVTLRNKQDVDAIVSILRYDRRKHGVHGRALVAGIVIQGVQLLVNDRLEPSLGLPDIGALEHRTEFPFQIIFWRTSEESLARHRNPVFEPELGITPARSVVVDVLHAVFLGILLVWCRCAVWTLLLNGAYGHAGENHEHLTISILVLRSNLMEWYPAYEKRAKEKLTRVADLTPSMLGKPGEQVLKTKAAETWGLTLFLIEQLRLHYALLSPDEGVRLLNAGENLERIVRIWKSCDWTVPAALQEASA